MPCSFGQQNKKILRLNSSYVFYFLFAIPIISIRNELKYLRKSSYCELEHGSFFKTYIHFLREKSFLGHALFCSVIGIYTAYKWINREWEPSHNNVVVELFVCILVWCFLTRVFRIITRALGLKSKRINKSWLSETSSKQIVTLSNAKKWGNISSNPSKKDLVTPWYIYCPYCVSYCLVRILCFLWEIKCFIFRFYLVWNYSSCLHFLPIEAWMQDFSRIQTFQPWLGGKRIVNMWISDQLCSLRNIFFGK